MKRNVLLVLGVLLAARPAAAVDLHDGLVHLRHVTYPVDAGVPGGTPARALSEGTAVATWIVPFDGPADSAARDAIEAAGGRVVGFVPSNAYLVRADVDEARAMGAAAAIRRVDYYRPEWKVAPELDRAQLRTSGGPLLSVEIWEGEDAPAVASRARALGIDVVAVQEAPGIRRLLVHAGPSGVDALAALSEVQWIEAVGTITLRNDTVRWIIQSNNPVTMATPLYANGILGRGEIIGHIDDPPYMASCYFLDPVDNTPGPNHRKVFALRRVGGPTSGAHGTHTAGTAAGENFDPAHPEWRGMAPKARLSCSSVWDLSGFGGTRGLAQDLALAHADGARIHTNSWGLDGTTAYTNWCVDIDTFSRLNEDDLVLFAVSDAAVLYTPENAKDCLAVGASYSQPDQDQRAFGGVGPTADGRRKPEVYAPGFNTRSAQTLNDCGTATMSGTSMACPAVAGGAALVREYFRRGYYPTGAPWESNAFVPTGALVKAAVINSAVDMTGVPGYPSTAEGWGRILLDDALYFPGDARRLWVRDVRHAQGLSTGQTDEWHIRVQSSAEPLKITMVFMDQPAALNASLTPVNDLDLEVVGPSGLLRGNVIDANAGESIPGGAADPLNDVERVLVAAPTVGDWTIRVRGTSVPIGPQGFAVVVNGALASRDARPSVAPDLHAGPEPRRAAVGPAPRVEVPTPNPFTGSTTLRFAVPVRAEVSIRVYDVSGRAVRSLLAQTVEAGEQHVIWDGRDDEGRRVSAGVYFFRLTMPGFERLVKTALLR
ncbi:MAG: S8 family serine peptidase [bacterium]